MKKRKKRNKNILEKTPTNTKYAIVDTNVLIDSTSIKWLRKMGYQICIPYAVKEEVEYNFYLATAVENAKLEPKVIAEKEGKKGFKILATKKGDGQIIMQKVAKIPTRNRRQWKKVIIEKEGKNWLKIRSQINQTEYNTEYKKLEFIQQCKLLYEKMLQKKVEFKYLLIGSKGTQLIYGLKARFEALNKELKKVGVQVPTPQINDFRIIAAAEKFLKILKKKGRKKVVEEIFSNDIHMLMLQNYKEQLNIKVDIKNPGHEKWVLENS